ncbi:MAG: GNAT family N-acetyltransferase [Vicinamibacterales bacterium]
MTRPSGPVIIRPARPDDRGFVLATTARLSAFGVPHGRTAPEIVEGEARTLRAHFDAASPLETLLIAERDGTPSGFVFLEEHEDYFTRAIDGHIGILVVAEQAEGRGVGAALMVAAEEWARSRGHSSLTLNVFEGNQRARALYQRAGFRPDTIKYRKAL